ncbi:serine/threonine-protein kinase [Catenulispora rubra]|uniref:serine/threonine-protein kinase n=1 Tax=Catenulispora rubra TaxID=280293 RepID=UPI001892705B|nr:serine/threonine-protein kinase [Catenulispora rubra]
MSESTQSHQSRPVVGGRYLLRRLLGTGGMGRVWLAHDERSGIDVALKEVRLDTMAGHTDRKSYLSRAWLEALHGLSVAKSSNIVEILDVFEEDGRPWIVMELVIGKTLAQAVAQYGPLPPVQVAHIGKKVLMALTACHVKEIVHRDVKPSNILLADDGRVLLTDFGIAAGGGHYDLAVGTLTPNGIAVGTPEFMAPERMKGRPATAASDLFSLGVTLYFAVEGRSPFRRDSFMASSAAVLFEPADELHRGPVFEQLLSGLMEKDPADRMPTAEAYDQLTRIIAYNGTIPCDSDVPPILGPAGALLPVHRPRFTEPRPAKPAPRHALATDGAYQPRPVSLGRASAAVAVAITAVLATSLFLLRSGTTSTAASPLHGTPPPAATPTAPTTPWTRPTEPATTWSPGTTSRDPQSAPPDQPTESTPASPEPSPSIQCLEAGSGIAVKPGLQDVTVADINSCLPTPARLVLGMYPIGTCLSDWPPGPPTQPSDQCGQLVNGSVIANRVGAVWLADIHGGGSTGCQGADVKPDGETWILWTDGLTLSLCAIGAKG